MKKILVILLSFTLSQAFAVTITSEPVENKVVEIHMSNKIPSTVSDAKHRRKTNIIPLPGQGICSGAFIDDIGDIITARHCVEGYDTFAVITSDRQEYMAIILATSTIHDLALLHIDYRNTKYFKPAVNIYRGESISVLGSPLGIQDTLSEGVISRINGDITLIDCSVLPGNSGGPVFDKDGKLVGIVSAGYVVMMGMTHLNIVQGIDAIWFFVQQVFSKR